MHPCPDDNDRPPVLAPRTVPGAMDADARCSTRLTGKPRLDYCCMHEGEWALSVMESVTELMSYAEVLCWEDYPIWQKAMEMEMAQHAEVGTWELAELSAGKNVVDSQWVYAEN